MQRTFIIGGVIAALVLILLASSFFIVPLDQQAIVLRFGQYQYAVNGDPTDEKNFVTAGLHLKVPFVDDVRYYDKRNMGYDLRGEDGAGLEIIAADQQRLKVDAIARWRIKDPIKFFRGATTTETGEQQLSQRFTAALLGELGKVNQPDIISGQRVAVMTRVRTALQSTMDSLGVEIIDVRIRQADLPEANSKRTYERMKSQLQQKVNQYQAEGEKLYASIKGEADKQVSVILAEAQQKAQETKGEGDAERNKIYASAYNKDPEFFSFYRSLEAYDKAIKEGTPMVISPDSDFFKYFKSAGGK